MQARKFFKSNNTFSKLLFVNNKKTTKRNKPKLKSKQSILSSENELIAMKNIVNATEILTLSFASITNEQNDHVYYLQKILDKLKDVEQETKPSSHSNIISRIKTEEKPPKPSKFKQIKTAVPNIFGATKKIALKALPFVGDVIQGIEYGYETGSVGRGIAAATGSLGGRLAGGAAGTAVGGPVGGFLGEIEGGTLGAAGGARAYDNGMYWWQKNAPSWLGGGGAGSEFSFTGDDQQIIKMIQRHEGKPLDNRPYKDSRGLWTVGYGHLIGDGTSLPPEMNRTFSDEEINQLFQQDYAQSKDAAEKIPGYNKANATGKAAIIDLTYNMGPNWYKNFPNASAALAQGDFNTFAAEMQNSAWFQQVGNRGLEIVAMIKSAGSDVNLNDLDTRPGIDLSDVDPNVISGIKMIQQQFGKKLIITSASRNQPIPGVMGPDAHQMHKAVDISTNGLNDADLKQLTQLALNMGFTGIGLEGNHLHLDNAHSGKTLWGSDYHYNSAPEWAKSMDNWSQKQNFASDASREITNIKPTGNMLASSSTNIEATELSTSNKNVVIALNNQQKESPNILGVSTAPTINEVPISMRLKQTFPQLTTLAA
jgi:GH24 family phage-related lysozyme (muramidase)